MSLANAIALTAQRMATNGGNEIPAVPSRSSARAIGSPTTSPATISLPKRGVWPPNTMSPSDFSDNTLEYRSGGMRSPAFPWPQPITNNTATPAQTAAESATAITTWNRNKVYNPGDVVVFANSPGGIYQCVSQNKNIPPPQDSNIVAAAQVWVPIGAGTTQSLAASVSGAAVANNAVDISGRVNLSSAQGVSPLGSVAGLASPYFTWEATDDEVEIFWSNFTIYMLDGTTIPVPDGSQTITGLAASTPYTFFPYYNLATGSIAFVTPAQVQNQTSQLAGVEVAGAGDVLTTNEISYVGSSPYSVEMWFYATSGTGNLIELNANQSGSPSPTYGASLAVDSYQLEWTSTAGDAPLPGGTLTPGQWHYIAATWNGISALKVYLDGVQVSGTQTPGANVDGYWRIGDGRLLGNASGVFSRVAVYSSVLTATQVNEHYAAMLSGGTPAYDAAVEGSGPTSYWLLDESTGTTAADSVDSNTGTYTGTYTLAQSETFGGAFGTPQAAWLSPTLPVVQAQFTQGGFPLAPGGFTVTTPSTGTTTGIAAGYTVPYAGEGSGSITISGAQVDVANTWTAEQTFAAPIYLENILYDSTDSAGSAGQVLLSTGTGVEWGTLGLEYGGTDANLSATGGTSQVLMQTSSGAAITVAQLAASNLANGTTGSGAVVLAASPTLSGTLTCATLAATTINGCALSGTFSGSPTFSGAPVFSGNVTFDEEIIDSTGSPGTGGYILSSQGSGSGTKWIVAPSGFANPMTTLGDIIYENATPAPARLAGNTTATKNFLTQTGTGSASAAPAWGTIAIGDLPTSGTWAFAGTLSGNFVMTGSPTLAGSSESLTLGLASYTAAVSNSPELIIAGSYESASTPTYAEDSWTIQDVVGSGVNGPSALTLSHSGSAGTNYVFVDGANLALGGSHVAAYNFSLDMGASEMLLVRPGSAITGSAGVLFQSINEALNAGEPMFFTATQYQFLSGAAATWMVLGTTGGMQLGAPTSGDEGVGTLNVASGIYLNGSAYTHPDYVFEKAFTGNINKFADNPGAKGYEWQTLDQVEDFAREHFELPRVGERRELFSRADVLLEKVEEIYLHLFEMNKANKELSRQNKMMECRLAALEAN